MRRARECLDEIVSLYQAGPNEKAPELLQRITDLYFLTLDQQSAAEMGSFGDVMIRMSQSADPLSRARFAERIANAERLPIELLTLLAHDEICVARPILQYSKCLREGDLVSIISDVGQEHLGATAHRLHLTQPVTDILVARGNEDVLVTLAGNVGADLSSSSRDRLYAIAAKEGALLDALNSRRDTTVNPIRKLKRLADAEFWHQVAETLLMSEDDVGETEAELAATATETASAPEKPDAPAEKEKPASAPAFTRGNAALNEKLLVEAARGGKVEETLELLARITSLDRAMVEHCLFQAHLPALMVLCKAHKLGASTFTALLQLRESRTETEVPDMISLLRRYEAMTPNTAQRVIRFADKSTHEAAK